MEQEKSLAVWKSVCVTKVGGTDVHNAGFPANAGGAEGRSSLKLSNASLKGEWFAGKEQTPVCIVTVEYKTTYRESSENVVSEQIFHQLW